MGTNFRAWMATIIRNTFINKCRAKQKRRTVSEPIESFTYSIESQNIIANQGEMDMRIQEIYRALDQLSDIYRIPFIMHFQGYEYKDIAEHLDLPIGTIKSRLHTARATLKKMIRKQESLPAAS
jgi:RNA polymerase sigma-70 factor (ECF subfamily)